MIAVKEPLTPIGELLTERSNLGSIPREGIFQVLGLKDLGGLGQVNKHLSESPELMRVWRKRAAASLVGQVDWRSQRCDLPKDIESIREKFKTQMLTKNEIGKLRKFVIAFDTIGIWNQLSRQAGLGEIGLESALQSFDSMVKKAEKFPNWIKEHQAAVNSIKKLHLNGLRWFPSLGPKTPKCKLITSG